jgi:hypothetical protein
MCKLVTGLLINKCKLFSGRDTFWLFLLTAKIQKDMGQKADAKASAEKCIAIATEAKNADYVRMAKELINKL